MKKGITILLIGILLLLFVWYGSKRYPLYETEIQTQFFTILKSIIVEQNNTITTLQKEGYADSDIRLANGLTIDEVKTDLFKHRELIPYEGVLGGTPSYYMDSIYVSNNYALAYTEDGHIGCYMLLSYIVSTDNRIDWTLVASVDLEYKLISFWQPLDINQIQTK